MTESAKMKLRENDPKNSKMTTTKIFYITLFLLSIATLVVNSEFGRIWLLDLTISKLTSQLDSSVSIKNVKEGVSTNITFLLARKFDSEGINQKTQNQQTIRETISDFWDSGVKRTLWKPGLSGTTRRNDFRGLVMEKMRKRRSAETGETENVEREKTGQAKLARLEIVRDGETVQAKLDRSKATSNRAQSNKGSRPVFRGLSATRSPCQVSMWKRLIK